MTCINEPIHAPGPRRQRPGTVARAKQREEGSLPVRLCVVLLRKSIVAKGDGRHPGRNRDRGAPNGDDGGKRPRARGLRDGRGVARRLPGHGDGDGQRVAGQRALDGVGGAGVVAELVLLHDGADFLGAAVEVGFGRDAGAVGELEGVRQRGVCRGGYAGGDGACRCLSCDEVIVLEWQGKGCHCQEEGGKNRGGEHDDLGSE